MFNLGFPWCLSGIECISQCRRPGFHPLSGKIPHASEQLIPDTLEPSLVAQQQEKPPQQETCLKHQQETPQPPCWLQLGKSPRSNEDPAQPKKSSTYKEAVPIYTEFIQQVL